VTEYLLNKEALHAMAAQPAFRSFGFLGLLRNRLQRRPRNPNCSSCPPAPAASTFITDSEQEVVLQALVPGGSFANEVTALKRATSADVLVLPTQRGLIRI
jgi:hypothetical protein